MFRFLLSELWVGLTEALVLCGINEFEICCGLADFWWLEDRAAAGAVYLLFLTWECFLEFIHAPSDQNVINTQSPGEIKLSPGGVVVSYIYINAHCLTFQVMV